MRSEKKMYTQKVFKAEKPRKEMRERERELRGITLRVFTKELTETMKIFPSTSNNALEI